MLNIFNNFLNSFEGFCWRLFIALIGLVIAPFVVFLFVFGFLDVKPEFKKKNEQ